MTTRPGNDVVTPDRVRGPRWIVAPSAVLEDARLSDTDLRVFLAICQRADNETGKAWPSIRRLARESRCGKTSVLRALPRLIDFGWISSEARWKPDGSADTTIYTVNYDYRLKPVPDHIGDPATEADAHEPIEVVLDDGGPNLDPRGSGVVDQPGGSDGGTTWVRNTGPRGGSAAAGPERLNRTNSAAAARAREAALIDTGNVRAQLDPRAHAAYDHFCAIERSRGATAAVLALVAEPIEGGASYTWPEISTALIEINGNADFGGRINAPIVRGVCRRIRGGGRADTLMPSSLQRAQAFWSLAMEKGLAQPASRETLLEQCDALAADPRLAAIGCANGRALFDLVCAVRLHELSGRSAKDERFTLRDLAARLEQFTLRAAS